jgi:hypothetical protein
MAGLEIEAASEANLTAPEGGPDDGESEAADGGVPGRHRSGGRSV